MYFDSWTKIPFEQIKTNSKFCERKIRVMWFRIGCLFWWISSWCCIKKSIPFVTPITIKGPAHAQIFNVFQHINIVVICKLLIRSSFIFFTTSPHVIGSWRLCVPKKFLENSTKGSYLILSTLFQIFFPTFINSRSIFLFFFHI